MENTLKQAKDFWLSGELSKCILVLQKLFPENDELNEIASSYNDNEKSFLRGMIERSAYDVARNKVRFRLQDYLETKKNSVYKILYIASNPTQLVQLNYGKEYDTIQKVLEMHDNKASFIVTPKFSASKIDLAEKIKKESPRLIYISLHGTENNELVFTDEYGRAATLSIEDLLLVLKDVCENIEIDCIFFSACTSVEQAKQSITFVPYAIGMTQEIDDVAGIVFAQGFFSEFFNDPARIKKAFDNGIIHLTLSDNPGIKQCVNIPVFFTNKN